MIKQKATIRLPILLKQLFFNRKDPNLLKLRKEIIIKKKTNDLYLRTPLPQWIQIVFSLRTLHNIYIISETLACEGNLVFQIPSVNIRILMIERSYHFQRSDEIASIQINVISLSNFHQFLEQLLGALWLQKLLSKWWLYHL